MTCLFQTNLVFALFVDVACNVTTVTCISTTDGLMFFFSPWNFSSLFSFPFTLSLSLSFFLAGFHLDRCFLSGLWRKIKHKSRCEVYVSAKVCVHVCACLRQTERGWNLFSVHDLVILTQLKEEGMKRNKVKQTYRKRERVIKSVAMKENLRQMQFHDWTS